MKNLFNNPLISVIIRAKNEEVFLERVLLSLKNQTYKHFEIIVVDNDSTDRTLEIAKKYGCKIVHYSAPKFSHPHSQNLWAENASGEFLVYLNGHSIPAGPDFLEGGLRHFRNSKVAWVYALWIAHKNWTMADKLLYNIVGYTIWGLTYKANKNSAGLLATTNAMIRKSLRDKNPFNESLHWWLGGEDYFWALDRLREGYNIIHDPKLRVRHSHYLKVRDIVWQLKNRYKMWKWKWIPEVQKRNFN